jgi:diguanylate cyclase (GGDEF)-like protein
MTVLRDHDVQVGTGLGDFDLGDHEDGLTTCDREPIHLSGAIQPHGVLLALREADLIVCQVSANTGDHLGVEPSQLLGAPLVRALGGGPVERLRSSLTDPRAPAGPHNVTVPNGRPYEMTWHRSGPFVIVELEPADSAGAVPLSAAFEDIRRSIQNLQNTRGVQALCDSAAAEIKHLTGYDRVMVYRFHPDWHGEVVAEQREAALEPFLGLHYPASDIPVQARKLYRLNHLRVIADVDYTPVPLLSNSGVEIDVLDLSLSGLRSVSPFHLAYLRNMGVQATMTISLLHGTRLWGMLACHHGAPKLVDVPMQAACRVLGQAFSLQVVTQEAHERNERRTQLLDIELQLVARMSSADSLASVLGSGPPSALALTGADGMVARIDGQTVTVGAVPPAPAVEALVDRLCRDDEPAALICDDLPRRFVELIPYPAEASGVLALPLSAGYQDFVLWFRGEMIHEVLWAGDPNKAMTTEFASSSGEATLGPRQSFAVWAQEVRGRCRPWSAAEIDAARALARAVPEFQLAQARLRLNDLARVSHLATHDPLTGLPNRSLLLDRAKEALEWPPGEDGGVVLLFVDLDRFKLINDSLGHAAGDNLLCQAAQRLKDCVRETETVARIGGDEFVILGQRMTAVQADHLAERIVLAFRQPFRLGGHEALVTTSIGVASAESGSTAAGLLRDADSAMYRAKHTGRNSAKPFTQEMRSITLRRIEIETNLRPALERGELRLHFQPIFTIDGVLAGFEALARWPLANRGMVPPAEFIPVAEQLGLFGPLTDWVLDEGLSVLERWRCERPDLNLTLAVNIAATQMTNDNLLLSIDKALRQYHLPAEALCLEITESALVTDDDLSRRFLGRLRDQGIRLSIDDFGTGFSSLTYLTKLPVHELKIDRAFIARLPNSPADLAVVASVVGLAHQLGLQALAEGVETAEQLTTVRRLGCDLVQGYFYAPPMDAEAIGRFLRP